MARYNTIMIETGTILKSTVGDTGILTVNLESAYKNTPVINAIAGPVGSGTDVGSANLPSFNVNVYITSITKTGGNWSFSLNTEGINEHVVQSEAMKTADGTYGNVQIIWRATGPVSAT